MNRQKIILPPNEITTRLDGWIGAPDRMPAAIAELIVGAKPSPPETIAVIRARMIARHIAVVGHV